MVVIDGLFIPVVIGGAIGLFLISAGLREAYFAVRLWRTRPVPIGELDGASGTVTVAGRVEQIETLLTAPLTGTDCIGYVWRVGGLRTTRGFDGRIEQSHHQLGRGQQTVRFRLKDYSGSVVVDPAGATLRLAEQQVTDPVSDPVNQADMSRAGVTHNGHRQYYESRIDDGETILVQGTVQPSEDPLLDVERIGVQLSGRGLYIADTDRTGALRRSAGAAILSLSLGGTVFGVLAVLFGAIPL